MSLEIDPEPIVHCNSVRPGLHNDSLQENGGIVLVQQSRPIDSLASMHGHSRSNLMNKSFSSMALEQLVIDKLVEKPVNLVASIEVAESDSPSSFRKPSCTSNVTTSSMDQPERDNLIKQSLSSLASVEVPKPNGLSGIMKPSLTSRISTDQSERGNLMNCTLSSLSGTKVANPSGLSGCIKPSPTSKMGKNSLGQSDRDNAMSQSLSSLASVEVTESNSQSGCIKPSFASKVTKSSLGQFGRSDLMKQSLSSLASMEVAKSDGLPGSLAPSLTSKVAKQSPGQSLSSLASMKETKPNGLSRFINPSPTSKVTANLSGQSLSSLASMKETKPNGLSRFMNPSLTSKVTANSSGQSLSSLASMELAKSDSLSGALESPHTSSVTTTSSHVSKSEMFVKSSLISLLASKPVEQSQSDRILDSSSRSLAEHPANTDLFSSPQTSIALAPPGLKKSLQPENGAIRKDVHALESNILFSGDTLSAPLTPLKSFASSDLAVRSSGKFSSEMETASLSDIARKDKTANAIEKTDSTTNFNVVKLASKVGQNGVLSGVGFPEIDSIDDETGTSIAEMVSVQNSPLLEGPSNGRTCEGASPTCVKKMSTSLRKLSLESALKRFPNKTNGVTALHSINKRLHENGRVPGSSIKSPESPLSNHNTAFDVGSISSPTSIMTDCEDTVMDNDSDLALKTIPMVTNSVRKRKASLFGQALSALHEPKVKRLRRDPLYDNTHGFALPVTVDLRALLGSNHKLNAFNFSVPSLDDVVRLKQSQAFSMKKRRHVLPDTHTFKTAYFS